MLRAVLSCALRGCTAAGLAAGLVACGGGESDPGSDSGPGADAAGANSLVVYSRNSMAPSEVPISANNVFDIGRARHTLKEGAKACLLETRPRSMRPADCAPLPGGDAFLACDRDNAVELVLLRREAFQEVSWAKVNRRTLTKVTCGDKGLQELPGSTVTFRGYPGSAKERHVTQGSVTGVTYDSENLIKLFSAEGNFGSSTLVRHRWSLYQSQVGTSTLYVLVDAYQGSFTPAPAVYVVQVP
ncbi:MAG: hypothetical protein K0S48_376 [Ramlibacter sp.]|jgi:hypothetical protein|nr:hypothetical protein [Ramlibacter sp.]